MTAVVVVAGLAAVASAGFVHGATLPFALLAAALYSVPDGRPAAYLLAAAAVVAAALHRRGAHAAVLGLPGGVAAATAIAGGPVTVARVAAAVALATTALLLTGHEADADARPHPVPFLLGAWLVLAPTTLPWAGDAELGPYQAGIIRAAVGAALAVVGAQAWYRLRVSR